MNTSLRVTWKPIPGFRGYEVSNEGEVRSFRRRGKGAANQNAKLVPTRVNPFLHSHGTTMRWAVKLSPPNGKRTLKTIAVLVLLAFVGPAPRNAATAAGSPVVEFLDGNYLNCHLRNIRWKTNP